MKTDNLSNIEKRQLSYQRQNAVRQAWKLEKNRILAGFASRNWSKEEQKGILSDGYVQGYEGHHMKSVSLYPAYAGDPHNIQFLTEDEHLYGAHQGSYHIPTNGYYDPVAQVMHEFDGDDLEEIPLIELRDSAIDSESNLEYCRKALIDEYQTAREEAMTNPVLEQERTALASQYTSENEHSVKVGDNSQRSEENQSMASGYGYEKGGV